MVDLKADYIMCERFRYDTWDRQSRSAGEGQNRLEPRLGLHPSGVEPEAQGRQRPIVAPGGVETWNSVSRLRGVA